MGMISNDKVVLRVNQVRTGFLRSVRRNTAVISRYKYVLIPPMNRNYQNIDFGFMIFDFSFNRLKFQFAANTIIGKKAKFYAFYVFNIQMTKTAPTNFVFL